MKLLKNLRSRSPRERRSKKQRRKINQADYSLASGNKTSIKWHKELDSCKRNRKVKPSAQLLGKSSLRRLPLEPSLRQRVTLPSRRWRREQRSSKVRSRRRRRKSKMKRSQGLRKISIVLEDWKQSIRS